MSFLARFSSHPRGFGFLDPVAADGVTRVEVVVAGEGGRTGRVDSVFVPPQLANGLVADDLVRAEAELGADGRAAASEITLERRDLAVQVGVVQPGPSGMILERDGQLGGGWIRTDPALLAGLQRHVNRQLVVHTALDELGRSVADRVLAGPHVKGSPAGERARAVVVALGKASPRQVRGGALPVGLDDASTQAMHERVTGMLAAGERGLAAGLSTEGTIPGAGLAPVDRRNLALVTIDDPSARDLDDAVTATWGGDPDAPVRVGVFIADPAGVVGVDSDADRYARAVAASAYAIAAPSAPMLDPTLSEDRCSLLPGVERSAIGTWLLVAPDGSVAASSHELATIRSTARLAYDDVEALLEGDDAAVRAAAGPTNADVVTGVVTAMVEAARRLAAARESRGTLDALFVEPEVVPVIGDDGRLAAAPPTTAPRANKLVERLMVVTNEVVAAHLAAHDVPVPYRAHEGLDRDRLPTVVAAAEEAGAELPSAAAGATSADLDALVAELAREVTRLQAVSPSGASLLSTVVAGAMARAAYAPEPAGHRGLGAATYVHFTSPIRRYADLVVHRQLRALMAGEALPYDRDRVAALCPWLDARAGALDHAEALERNALLARLVDRGGLVEGEEAVITGITQAGVRVRLQRLGLGGFVTAEALLGLDRGERGTLTPDELGLSTPSAGGHRVGDRLAVTARGLDETGRPRLVPAAPTAAR